MSINKKTVYSMLRTKKKTRSKHAINGFLINFVIENHKIHVMLIGRKAEKKNC